MTDIPVRVLITGTADSLRKELDGAGKDVQSFGSRLSSGLNSASTRLTSLGGRMSLLVTGPLALLGGGMVTLVKRISATADALSDSAKGIGIPATALQELRFALGEVAGISEGEVERSRISTSNSVTCPAAVRAMT